MLKSLYINNYALIDSLEIDFQSGFSVITGETGAGKSIILGALSLILGQRADTKAIKNGEAKCVIEGVFDVSAYDLKAFCQENDIEYDPDSYILRREILSSGKSRAFINDSPVSLNDLKILGEQLIDIHSQHKNLLLSDSRFQMQVLDILSNSVALLKEYQKSYKEYRNAQRDLDELIALSQRSRDDEDYLRFQYNALAEAKIVDGEQDELEQELETLNHAEEIKQSLYKIYSVLSNDENGVVVQLKEALNTSQGLAHIFSKSEDIIHRLDAAYIDLKDLTPEIERMAEDVEFNPERLEFIQNRLDMIYSLQQKHRVSTIADLISIFNDLETKIDNIDSYDQKIDQLQKEVDEKRLTMLALAEKLSKQRHAATSEIENQLIEKVSVLGMPNIRFECRISDKEVPDMSGKDDLQFMFSANKNVALQPISEIASGGEISRVMLCLKSMIAGATALPTIIFDEIDTGVSGEIADRMGKVMREFGDRMQVIAITHLPQIAAKGDVHYFVYKIDNEETTSTNIRRLNEEERIQELAQMLSGAEVTQAAIENAKVMLKR
ncbi:MAG: DNA repair protein RecN [Dysgonomonas sp.]